MISDEAEAAAPQVGSEVLDRFDHREKLALSHRVVTLGLVETSAMIGDDAFGPVVVYLLQARTNSYACSGVGGDDELPVGPRVHQHRVGQGLGKHDSHASIPRSGVVNGMLHPSDRRERGFGLYTRHGGSYVTSCGSGRSGGHMDGNGLFGCLDDDLIVSGWELHSRSDDHVQNPLLAVVHAAGHWGLELLVERA